MVVQNFYSKLIKSGIFYLYVNVVFFSTIIFYAVNDNLFTTDEMMFGIVAATVTAKAISNTMCAWGVKEVDLEAYREKLENQLKEKQAAMAMVDLRYKNKHNTNKQEDDKNNTEDKKAA